MWQIFSRTFLRCGGVVLLTSLTVSAGAQSVYRSVDENGRVIFSDSPTPGATSTREIEVQPHSRPEAEAEESRRRAEQAIRAADESQQRRDAAKAEREAAVGAAEQRVREAEAALAEAREVGEGDRRGTAGGGSRLTPEYEARVRAAEAERDRARRELDAARTAR
jgi:hypothetical protein